MEDYFTSFTLYTSTQMLRNATAGLVVRLLDVEIDGVGDVMAKDACGLRHRWS